MFKISLRYDLTQCPCFMLCHLMNKISLKYFFGIFCCIFCVFVQSHMLCNVGFRLSMFCYSLSQTFCTYKAMFNHFHFPTFEKKNSNNLISIYHPSPKYYSWAYHIRVLLKMVPCWTSLWPPIWCLKPFWLYIIHKFLQ
jgi:hypothetical protein